jgi:hypothetical protein
VLFRYFFYSSIMAQHIDVHVVPGPERPVVVKSAADPVGVATLAREAARLERGRHPGVVEVLEAGAGRLELAWVGSHTLETTRLSVPAAAGVLAAVAATVADLHGLGIVHGRLDPGHVVLAADGRPVLCGLRGPLPGEPEPGPAEDVAAVGRLVDHLLGPDAEPEPIPDRRWARRPWSGYHRRTLQLLADRATHEDPARRPTARALANAIVEAVPDARLVPTTASAGSTADHTGPAAGPAEEGPGPAAPIEPTADGGPVAGRSPAGRSASPPTHRPTPGEANPPGAGPTAPPTPAARVAGTGSDAPTWPAPPVPATTDATATDPPGPDPLRAGPFLAAACRAAAPSPLRPPTVTATATAVAAATPPSTPPSTILGLRLEPADPPPPTAASGSVGSDQSDRSRPLVRSGTDPAGPTQPTRPGSRLVVAALAGALLLIVAGSRLGRDGHATADPRPGGAPAGATPPGSPSTTGTAPTDPADQVDQVDRVETIDESGDDTGDDTDPGPGPRPGPSAGPGVVLARADERYGVGERGDLVAVGDWDCDGTATPGVLRPGTGEIFLFDAWAEPGAPVTVSAALQVTGARTLLAEPAGCGARLTLADGSVLAVRPTADGWTTAGTS